MFPCESLPTLPNPEHCPKQQNLNALGTDPDSKSMQKVLVILVNSISMPEENTTWAINLSETIAMEKAH
jgi:hypothetical protein